MPLAVRRAGSLATPDIANGQYVSGNFFQTLGVSAWRGRLFVNADDLGMCESVNLAILRAHREGLVRSTSLMAPWPGAAHAMELLRAHPELTFGVHLSVICDMPGYRPSGAGSPGAGHLAVFCTAAPGCRSVWYRPRHQLGG